MLSREQHEQQRRLREVRLKYERELLQREARLQQRQQQLQPQQPQPPQPQHRDFVDEEDDSHLLDDFIDDDLVDDVPVRGVPHAPAPPRRHAYHGQPRRERPAAAAEADPRLGGGAAGIQGDFWRCAQCTVANESILVVCLVCNAQRPHDVEVHAANGARVQPQSKFVCAVCTYVNADSSASQCEMCGSKRAAGASESKEDEESNALSPQGGGGGGSFVLGSSAPPPLRRPALVREHLAFLAGLEEAFGSVQGLSPQLLLGVEKLVQRPFEALIKQYGKEAEKEERRKQQQQQAMLFPPSAAAAGAASPPRPSAAASASAALAPSITSDILNVLLKALVYRGAQQAVRIHRHLDLLINCCLEEEDALRALSCNLCGTPGRESQLHLSECAPGLNHAFCLGCSHHLVMDLVSSKRCARILCPFVHRGLDGEPLGPNGGQCGREVDIKFVRRCLSGREFQQYLDECFQIMVEGGGGGGALSHGDGGALGPPGGVGGEHAPSASNFLRCPNANCNALMEVDRPHGLVVPTIIHEVDAQGKTLTPAAWLHFSEFRVRCHAPGCSTNFCKGCRATPYHMGRTCAEQQSYQAALHCRFCTEQLTADNTDHANSTPAFHTICTDDTCQQRKAMACASMLPCGHPCPGIRDEAVHPSCLLEDCPSNAGKEMKSNSEDLCAICWTEELGLAPVITLTSCNHTFHAHCVLEKIKKKWSGTRITFGFLDCSQCKCRMDHPSPLIQSVLRPMVDLYESVRAKALARLKIEKMEQDPKVVTQGSQFYGRPDAYALASFAYYNCFKCKKFYFGGRRDCEQNAAAEVRPEEEFVCYDCADLKSIKCRNADHAEYQVFKCRFCCNLASWFCFGTTHYCEPCHKDNPMEKVKRKRSGFKQCPGYQMCPCKMAHSPNGAEPECEFCLGCGACQEELSRLQAAKEKDKQVDNLIDQQLKGKGGAAAGSAAAGSGGRS